MLAVDNSFEFPTAHTFAHKLHSHRSSLLIFFYQIKNEDEEEDNKVVARTYVSCSCFSDEQRNTLDARSDMLIVYVPIGEAMFPHLKPGASQSSIAHDSEQHVLSQWLNNQPAFKAVLAKLPKTDEMLSPTQIDSILAIRRRITETKHSHD